MKMFAIVALEITQALSDTDFILKFSSGAVGDFDESQILVVSRSGTAFHDVCGDRDRSTTYL